MAPAKQRLNPSIRQSIKDEVSRKKHKRHCFSDKYCQYVSEPLVTDLGDCADDLAAPDDLTKQIANVADVSTTIVTKAQVRFRLICNASA
jgi:hypothetical protein